LVLEATTLQMPFYKTRLEHKTVINELGLTRVNPVTYVLTFQAQGKIAFMGRANDE